MLRVVDKISDSALRPQLLNWLYFSRTQNAIREKRLIQARKLAAKVDELDQRAYLYFQIAEESLKQDMDQAQAREMLEEVVDGTAKAPATMVTARTQLGVAYLYTRIDLNRAIAVLGDAVKNINRIEQPDFSRQFVMRQIKGKTFGTYATFQTPGFNPENAFRELAKPDFDGTLYQASNLTDKPLRARTTLALIEPYLQPPQRGKARSQTTECWLSSSLRVKRTNLCEAHSNRTGVMTMNLNHHSVNEHFDDRAPEVKATYAAILKAAKKLGPVSEEPKKTSIHLVRKTAFAGVATRKTGLVLTLKSDSDVVNKRIAKREQASAHRWHLEIKLQTPEEVDRELVSWLRKAYELAG